MRFAAVLLLLLFSLPLPAQQYFVRNISMRDGLPFNQITTIFQDSRGFLWVGTTSGLARLDAFIKPLTFKDEDGLHTNYCVGIAEDRKGGIWVQTNMGVALMEEGRETFRKIRETNGFVPAIVGVGDYVYFPSDGEGLLRSDVRDPGRVTLYGKENGLPSVTIRDIHPLNPETLWLATGNGLMLVEVGRENVKVVKRFLEGVEVFQLELVGSSFKVATDEGLYTVEGDILLKDEQPVTAEKLGIRSLVSIRGFWPEESLALILPSGERTMMVRSGERWRTFGREEGLSSSAVTCLYQDREGVLWLGTNKGLDMIASPSMINYPTEQLGLRNVFVYAVHKVGDEVWVGSRAGMRRIDSGGMILPSHPLISGDVDVWDMEQLGEDVFLASTGCVLRIQGKKLKQYSSAGENPFGRLYDLDVLGGTLAVSGRNGLFIFEGEEFRKVELDEALAGLSIYSCHIDPVGRIWLCTLGKGVWVVTPQGETVEVWDESRGFPSNTVYDMVEYGDTRWFGTTRGIVGIETKNGSLLLPPAESEISRVAVPAIGINSQGLLWAGTLEGLFQYDPFNRKVVEKLTDRSGLLGTDVASSNGLLVEESGGVWLASASNGLSHYAPLSFALFPARPGVMIASVVSDEENLDVRGALSAVEMAWDVSRDVDITFSVLSFRNPDTLQLHGYLYPFESGYKNFNRDRSVRYTNLSPGVYTFHLWATVEGEESNEATLTLTILPPWWRTWWATSLCILILMGVGMGAYRLRIRKLMIRERELEGLVEQRTRDLVEEKEKLNQAYNLLEEEQHKSESLLLNVLPEPIAKRLKDGQNVIADSFNEVTVLFTDIVGFTTFSQKISPVLLVGLLNEIFSTFDLLAEKHDLEKIKTIGDAYMLVGGLPVPRKDHAQAVAGMALEMQEALSGMALDNAFPMKVRIGIHSGPVVAGVIGTKKFIYDLWGDTVNTASRMESHGEPERVQISEATYELIKDEFICERRGTVSVKGKGEMVTYWLNGVKE